MARAGAGEAGTMDALVLACEVIAPVLREVSAADDRSELEDGFAAVQASADAGDVHAVLAGPRASPPRAAQSLGDRTYVAPLPTSTVVPFVLPCRVTLCRELERTL